MPNVVEQLELLRQRIADSNESDMPGSDFQRLALTQIDDRFNLDFYGDPFEDSYLDLLDTLAQTEVAPYISSLILRGPDEGVNGTRHWDIEPLFATDATFPNLDTFAIPLNQPADHNRSIVGGDYDEDGVVAKLLAKSPRLHDLTVPSAPNSAFFDVGERPLRHLSIDAGYNTQEFILNLANSSCFPALSWLEWGEYHETYMDDFLANCTPLDHYRKLLQSNAFSQVTRFVWRNPVCTEDEIKELKSMKPDIQLLVVRFSDDYV